MQVSLEPLRAVDWANVDQVETAARKAMNDILDDRWTIRRALLRLPEQPDLLRLCRRHVGLDQITLWHDKSGIQVRLNVFLADYLDQPHYHRSSHACMILQGTYRHYIFGQAALTKQVDPRPAEPLAVRQEVVGDAYALHHTLTHSITAERHTVSLVLRGPAIGVAAHPDQLLAAISSPGDINDMPQVSAARQHMSAERVLNLTDMLRKWGLF